MLTRLIESRSMVARNESGTAASVAIHLVLITVAAYFTTAKAITDQEKTSMPHVAWIRPLAAAHVSAADNPRTTVPSRAIRSITAPASLSLSINTTIPDISVQLASVRPDDGLAGGVTGPSSPDTPQGIAGDPSQAFDVREVDTPASAIAGQSAPVYPPSLRAAGIEGRVVAQFVVDAQGQAVRESIRIISSSNDMFGASVRKAIEQMRFAPARIGTRPVSQVVQQLFVFRLDR